MPALDPRVDAYIAKAPEFARTVLEHLRAVVHEACPDGVEGIKWSMPFFMHSGRNLLHLGAFKQHVSLGLWYGEALQTPREPGQPGQGSGNFGRITQLSDLPPKRELVRLIRSGMAAIDAGAKGPGARQRGPRLPPAVPAELGQALTSNPAAKRFFNSLPPSAQREYTDWISEAKRAETRVRRLQQTIDQLTQGRRRYEKPGEAD